MWSGIADTCRIGGCSIISMLVVLYASGRDASRRASNSPSASSTSGSTARPTPTPTGCAQPFAMSSPRPPKVTSWRSPMRPIRPAPPRPSAIMLVARPTSWASQRKFSTAVAPPPAGGGPPGNASGGAPPPPAPPAAASAPARPQAPAVIAATLAAPLQVTRTARSAIVILPVQCLQGPVEVHRRRSDAEAEADQRKPRPRAQQPIREVPGGEADRHASEQQRPEIDELCGLTPRRPLLGRSHVNRNTITGIRG